MRRFRHSSNANSAKNAMTKFRTGKRSSVSLNCIWEFTPSTMSSSDGGASESGKRQRRAVVAANTSKARVNPTFL